MQPSRSTDWGQHTSSAKEISVGQGTKHVSEPCDKARRVTRGNTDDYDEVEEDATEKKNQFVVKIKSKNFGMMK